MFLIYYTFILDDKYDMKRGQIKYFFPYITIKYKQIQQ